MNSSRDGAQVPFDDGIGLDTEDGTGHSSHAHAGASADTRIKDSHDKSSESFMFKRPKSLQVADTDSLLVRVLKGAGHVALMVLKGILTLFGACLYPLALLAVIFPFMLPFLISDTNGSYDANAIYTRLIVGVLYIPAGAIIAALTVRWYRRDKFLKAMIAALIAVAAFGYGLVCTGSYATALAEGPKTMAVERPTVTRETKSDDDGDYQVCAMTFTPALTFDAGSCEDDGSISANNRIARDLLGIHSDHMLLHYYDTVTGPIYVGLEDDPRYS